jgi:pimeloyl-ACP methyl ester carboxylesterase
VDVSVALVEQPYRVAGRRAPAPAAQLDTAWLAVVDHLRGELPLLFGGRSSGARVACRTATAGGAAGVLCLAFPVHPPGRPEKDRLAELAAPTVPVLVVQGERDPFGRPEPAPGRAVVLPARRPQPQVRRAGSARRRDGLAPDGHPLTGATFAPVRRTRSAEPARSRGPGGPRCRTSCRSPPR